MAKFMVHVGIGFVGAEHHVEIDIPDEDLAGMSREEVEKRVYEDAEQIAQERLEYWITLGSDKDYMQSTPLSKKSLVDFELIPAPAAEEAE